MDTEVTIGIGSTVKYVDQQGQTHNALVTAIWGGGGWTDTGPRKYTAGVDCPCINLTFVTHDERKEDSWGRQVGREASVPHRSSQTAPGLYWE